VCRIVCAVAKREELGDATIPAGELPQSIAEVNAATCGLGRPSSLVFDEDLIPAVP